MRRQNLEAAATRSENLVRLIRPMFAGESPEVVSATLADLTATLLAGFQGNDVAVTRLRQDLLARHVAFILELVPVNELELWDRIQAHKNAPP